MALFSGVPYITETPSQAMRAPHAGAQLFAQGYWNQKRLREEQRQFDETMKWRNQQEGYEAQRVGLARQQLQQQRDLLDFHKQQYREGKPLEQLKIEAENARIAQAMGALEVDALKREEFVRQTKIRGVEYPMWVQSMQDLSTVQKWEDIDKFKVPSFITPEFQKSAMDAIQERRIAIAKQEDLRAQNERNSLMIKYNATRLERINKMDDRQRIRYLAGQERIQVKLKGAIEMMDDKLIDKFSKEAEAWDDMFFGDTTGTPVGGGAAGNKPKPQSGIGNYLNFINGR